MSSLLNLSILLILMLTFSSCSSKELTAKEKILDEKFYGYFLAEETETELGLTAQIASPYDEWDLPCQYPGPESPWNPLRVHYYDSMETWLFSIVLADSNVMWAYYHESREGKLEWEGETLEILISEESPNLIKFKDRIGNEVTISGNSEIFTEDEFFHFVQQLEFVGLDESEFLNPWSGEWCRKWSRKRFFISKL